MLRLSRTKVAYTVAIVGAATTLLPPIFIGGDTGHVLSTVAMVLTMLAAPGLGGWKPGMTGTLLIVLGADFFIFPPRHSLWTGKKPQDFMALAFLLILGSSFSLLGEGLHVVWRRLKNREKRLEEEVLERRKAELAVQEQAERWRVTLASIGDAVIATDASGRVTFLNHGAESLTGWSQTDAVGRPILEVFKIVNEMSRRPVDNPIAIVLEHNIVVGLANHTVLIRRDGTETPIDDSAAPIHNAAGQILGVVLVFRDVSERRAGELDRARLAAIVESSNDAIVGNAPDGIVTSWNQGAERLYGYAAEEMLGKRSSLLPPGQVNELPELMRRLVAGERIEHFETERLRKDGRKIDVSVAMSAIKDCYGNVVGASSIERDICERKHLELELRARADELAEADRRKDEFLAMLAHELRNPLAPIRTGLELLAAEREPNETVELMREQVVHMVRLVDDLLDVSRIMRGRIELKREPLEFGTVLAKAVETVRPFIEMQRHELSIRGPEEPLWLKADAVRLTQIITNLLSNAAKYTEPGGRIDVIVEREGNEAVLRVRDNGVGIDAELLPHVLNCLRKETDRSTVHRGLGIGLTLVRSLVNMHGGAVSASSPGAGRGSEFVARLPALAERAHKESELWKPQPARPMRVLIVDDQVGTAKLLSKMLVQFWAHDVRTAHDGITAIEEARRFRPDLILLDIGLPGLNGYEVAKRLREESEFAQTKFVAVTGYGQDEDRRRSLSAGFDEHLVKPASVEMLQSLFDRM